MRGRPTVPGDVSVFDTRPVSPFALDPVLTSEDASIIVGDSSSASDSILSPGSPVVTYDNPASSDPEGDEDFDYYFLYSDISST